MFAATNILCPVDTSECSRGALRHAVTFGATGRADVTVVAVRPPTTTAAVWFEGSLATAPMRAADLKEWDESVRGFVHDTVGSAVVRVIATEGAVVPEILSAAERVAADLIVLCTCGSSGFERMHLGSVTGKLLRAAPCPVLTIPRDAVHDDVEVRPRTIVCGVDSSPASRRAVEHALSLAQESHGTLLLVHALEDYAEDAAGCSTQVNVPACPREVEHDVRTAYEALVSDRARTRSDVRVIIGHGSADQELLRIAADWDADLLVVGTAGRGAPSRSTTEHIVRRARCPVLAVPAAPVAVTRAQSAVRNAVTLA